MRSFVICPRGPFSLKAAAEVVASFPPLRHQPRASDGAVRIGFVLDGSHSAVAASLREEPSGTVEVTFRGTDDEERVRQQVERIFSLDHDGALFPQLLRRDPKLAPIFHGLPGLRPVCFTSPYESACWAIISQRITTTQAARINGELVRAHGEVVTLDGERIGVFPRPDRLADVRAVLGLPALKLERLRAVAEAALDGELDAKRLRALGDVEGPRRLRELPGIGTFWASGVYLRACGIVDVFPEEPLSVAALGNLHGLGDTPSPADVVRISDRWRPYRMWIAFLLRVAMKRGLLVPHRASSVSLRAMRV